MIILVEVRFLLEWTTNELKIRNNTSNYSYLDKKIGNKSNIWSLFSAWHLKKKPTIVQWMCHLFCNTCQLLNDLEHACAQRDWGFKSTQHPGGFFFFHSEATIMILIMILPRQDQDRGFATHNRSFATKKNLCRAPRVSTQALTHERPEDAWIYFVGLLLGWNCLTL